MDWIKKNLVLVISGVVALGLLGFAGYFLYSKYSLSQAESARLEEQETKLNSLINQKPNPGNKKVDNIAAAKEQTQALTEFAEKAKGLFVNVPYPTNLDGGSFKLLLDNTIDELQRDARSSGTKIPENYAFTFSVQKPLIAVKASTIKPLCRTLMEIKSIVSILLDSKILEIDRIRRVAVPDEDSGTAMMMGGPSDYWTRKPTTNSLAIVMPYEFTFRCFSGELQSVLEGLASSPHNFLVKNLAVDTGETNTVDMFDAGGGGGEGETQMPRMNPQMMMMMRYGMRPGMGMRYMQPPPTDGDPSQAQVDSNKIVSEKPFRVTAWVDVVRMLGAEDAPAAGASRARRGGPPGGGSADAAAQDPNAAAATPGTN